jgi:hypothetical protein
MEEKEDNERVIYKLMKQRDISTLDLHRTLKRVGVFIPQKTLHTQLSRNFDNSKEPMLKEVALEMIKSYDDMIERLKNRK